MRSTKPRMVNRGVKVDLVAADPEAYKIDEEVLVLLAEVQQESHRHLVH